MTEDAIAEPTPEQAALFARVRRMMLIAGLTTAVAVGAVLIAIGYRLFRAEGSGASGSLISVRNAKSGRKFRAKVQEKGKVLVVPLWPQLKFTDSLFALQPPMLRLSFRERESEL